MRVKNYNKMFYLLVLLLISRTLCEVRPPNVWIEDTPLWSTRVEDYVMRPDRIRLIYTKPKNNGFYVKTFVEYWEVDTRNIVDNVTSHLSYYPTMMNNTAFYQEYTYNPLNWKNQIFIDRESQSREIWVSNLKSRTGYKFRFK
jgi:hypothetical protein